ncbi:asparagine synthase (glutamine-hydrolyzing) [Francisella philomiragia]|uniref:asparagine synthase (glutamine-hydrolyzing) n=1 Tax=Francisella philomiragia TaxID=28110 RepID=UPI0019070E19|nr:asparagine synthase (glutamine-hydrolyzing) [Francisella philomiragia]MBK2095859.1 asparagine synthase (glutamine-hydrolyzing) [Francisella philomiragia]
MCGIAGIITTNNCLVKTFEEDIGNMTDTIIHRGPDGFGYYYADNHAFGHRRLSIVDLSEAGHQPMHYLDRYTITYNGEIYNHIELRQELIELGYIFNSDTDTEVIMASYDAWGVECLNKFNGMWAFVIYDNHTKKYFMSRDRFGVKPFYFFKNSDTFLFASEIKAILEHPAVEAIPNLDFLQKFVNGYSCEYLKETAFSDIFRFDFSSYFEGTIDDIFDNFIVKRFWQIKPNLSKESFNKKKLKYYAQRYYDLLEDAVRIRLRADVKVGAALSGGLDSSSIVYLVNKQLKERGASNSLETFSSVYKSDGTQECDESRFIDEVANSLGVHSNQIEPAEADIPSDIENMIWHLENPPENSLMSSWNTFKLVGSSDVTITLDGQGADEQLAGYTSYLTSYIASLSSISILVEAWLLYRRIPGVKDYVLRGMCVGMFRNVFGTKRTKRLLNYLKWDVEMHLNQRLAEHTMSILITLIHYADHTSMAFSVESRMPFMDYRLVEFLASVPACYKIRKGWTKYLARVAFDGKLPDSVVWRKDKMGWPIPEKKWFLGGLSDWFLSKSNDTRILSRLNFREETRNRFPIRVKKLNLSLWYQIFIKK